MCTFFKYRNSTLEEILNSCLLNCIWNSLVLIKYFIKSLQIYDSVNRIYIEEFELSNKITLAQNFVHTNTH